MMLEGIVFLYSLYTFMRIYIAVMQIGYINQEKRRKPVLLPAGKYMVAGNYAVAKEKVNLVEYFVEYLLFLWWILKGFSLLASVTGFEGVAASVLFVLGFMGINALVSLPFDWYRQFRIEEAFGFNRMTPMQFIGDKLKAAAIFVVLGGAIFAALAWIVSHIQLWWLWGFVLMSGVVVLINLIYPTIIAPMFNRFTPLEEGELKNQIESMMAQSGLKSDGIFVMDASKRDGKLNAYFGGLGKSKRVVLFDTLLEKLDDNELLAVLAHELGHYTHGDVWKNIALTTGMLFVIFYLIGHIPDSLYLQMGVAPFAGVKIATLLLLLPLLGFFVMPVVSYFSRKHEYAADAYAAKQKGADALIAALLKLIGENKSFPKSHGLTVFFYHSHPPVLKRLEALGYDVGEQEASEDYTIDLQEETLSSKGGIFAFLDENKK